MTMPSTSPIAQPVRQCTVALNASALSERSGSCVVTSVEANSLSPWATCLTRPSSGRRSGAGISATSCPGTALGSTGTSCAARRSRAGRCTATCSRRCDDGRLEVGANDAVRAATSGSRRRRRARIRIGEGTFLNVGVMVAAHGARRDRRALHARQRLLRHRRQPPLRRPRQARPWQGFTTKGPTRIGDNVWLGRQRRRRRAA